MTVLLGPTPSIGCGVPVTVVRRPVVVWCSAKCRACSSQKGTKHRHGVPTALSEVVPVNAAGTRHECAISERAA